MNLFALFLLAGLTLMAVSLQRTYRHIPLIEMKRRARKGDELAQALYRAAGYGHSLRALLWLLIILSSGGFFIVLGRSAPTWFALTAGAILLWVGYVWLPAGRVTSLGEWLAARAAPLLAWILNYLHPTIDALHISIRRFRPLHFHTGLYEKEDLIGLLEEQQVQADNRIEQTELQVALAALQAGDKLVRDCMTPRKVVKMVGADETVGPLLMSELHQSGFSRFPVYEGKKDNIIGTLFLRDLVKTKAGGLVRKIMRPEVCFIHEEQSLIETLQAILKTRHHLFIVVNSFEEYVGVISMEDVLEQIIGSPIVDEFDQYEDLRAVAAKVAEAEHKEHIKSSTSVATEVDEVIELPE
jgi:CBS domain containing-hemolysin-like protein